MGQNANIPKHVPALLVAAMLVLSVSVPAAVVGMEADSGARVHYLRVAQGRPACSSPPALPIVPKDPGAHLGGAGTNCRDDRASALEIWLPEDRYLWLERTGPNPAAWIDVGPVAADAPGPEEAPLGLRLSNSDGSMKLETRVAHTATLTLLEPGRWQEITSPDGQRFWVFLVPREGHRAGGRGSVRRAD